MAKASNKTPTKTNPTTEELEEQKVDAPKRKRTTRASKKAETPTEDAQPSAEETVAAEQEAKPAAPAKKARASRTKKTAASKATAAEPAAPDSEGEAEKPKKRRSAAKKKAEEAVDEAPAAEQAAAEEAKPAKKPRTSRAKKAAAADAGQAPEEAASEEEPEVDEGPSIATNSDYSVTIDGYSLTNDYDGAPCIAINYTFTNVSSNEATSMQMATDINVYQNGVECEDAWFADDNSDGYTNKVKAGVSVAVTRVYKLQDTTSDVEVEVAPLFSWSDDLLAYQVITIA